MTYTLCKYIIKKGEWKKDYCQLCSPIKRFKCPNRLLAERVEELKDCDDGRYDAYNEYRQREIMAIKESEG